MAARPGGVARRAIAERFALNGKRGYRIQAYRPGSPHFPTFERTDLPPSMRRTLRGDDFPQNLTPEAFSGILAHALVVGYTVLCAAGRRTERPSRAW
jgi:hypothetical protein